MDCLQQDIAFYTHSSLMTSSPALQRLNPWTLGICMSCNPSTCLRAQSSASGEPQGHMTPNGFIPGISILFHLSVCVNTDKYGWYLYTHTYVHMTALCSRVSLWIQVHTPASPWDPVFSGSLAQPKASTWGLTLTKYQTLYAQAVSWFIIKLSK